MKLSRSPALVQKGNGNTDFTHLYKAVAVFCYLLLFLPFPLFLLFPSIPQTGLRLLLCTALFLLALLGYGFQILAGRVFSISLPAADFSYEDIRHRYRFFQAIFCHLAAVPVFLLAMRIGWTLNSAYSSHPDDVYSLFPALFALSCVFFLEFGGYLWFFPYNSLISMRRILTVMLVLLLNFVFTLYTGGKNTYGTLFTVLHQTAEILILSGFLILLNQSFLSRIYVGKVTRGINDTAKKYSVRVVLTALSAILLLPFLIYGGFVTVFSFFFRLIRRSVARRTTAPAELDASIQSIERRLETKLNLQTSAIRSWEFFFILTAVILLGILLFLTVPVFREYSLLLLKKFRKFLSDILHLSFSGWRGRKKKPTAVSLNFVDTVESTRKHKKAAFSFADDTENQRMFRKRLDALSDMNLKIRYAYTVVAAQMQHQSCQTLPSDTPREITAKAEKYGVISDFSALTDAYERLSYAEQSLSTQEEQKRILDRLCVLAAQYLPA